MAWSKYAIEDILYHLIIILFSKELLRVHKLLIYAIFLLKYLFFSERESILSIGSQKSTRSHSPLPASAALKVQQFGAWLRKLIAKYWALINCGLLLFISLRTPVVAYRVLYAFFFLVFVNCFQVALNDMSIKLESL